MSESSVKPQALADLGLPITLESEDGEKYTIDLFRPTVDTIDELWQTFKNFKLLFVDNVPYDIRQFTAMVMHMGTVILTVNDVGIIYTTDTRPGIDADAHFLFWDRRTRGRHRVIIRAFRWLTQELEIHKLNVSVPVYAFAALQRARKLGLRIEGLRRKAIMHEGAWRDVVEFGVLDEEITDGALANCKLERTPDEDNWFGLLRHDAALFRKVAAGVDTPTLEELDERGEEEL
jgi:hypothetical protein